MPTVKEIMTTDPKHLLVSDKISDAKKMMDMYCIRHVPIVSDNGELKGVITQRDILAAQQSSLENATISDTLKDADLLRFTTRPLHTASPHTKLRHAALTLQNHKIGCLPVVDNKKLVGIITDSDFVAIAINLLEIQEQNIPEELSDMEDELIVL